MNPPQKKRSERDFDIHRSVLFWFHFFIYSSGEERRYARVWIGVWESLQVPNHISSIKNISYFCRSVTDNTSDQFSAINSLTPSKPSFSPRTEHSYGGLFSNQYPTIQSSTHIFISLFSHVNIPLCTCRTATAQRFLFFRAVKLWTRCDSQQPKLKFILRF